MALAVVCMQWGDAYSADHVARLRAIVREHLPRRHRFVCISDRPSGLRARGIDAIWMPPAVWALPRTFPKVWLFSREAEAEIGADRILFLDLDVSFLRSLAPIVERSEPLVALPEFVSGPRFCRFNSSAILWSPGAAPQIWGNFKPPVSTLQVAATGQVGDDQVWMDLQLPPEVPTFGPSAGIRSYKFDYLPNGPRETDRVIVFHGKPKPWECDILPHPDGEVINI